MYPDSVTGKERISVSRRQISSLLYGSMFVPKDTLQLPSQTLTLKHRK